MTAPPIPFHEGLEQFAVDETEDIERTVALIRSALQQKNAASGLSDRDVHAKGHGSVRGKFRVLPNLPAELAQGLFARPTHYDAVVRFSNAAPRRRADLRPDARGMAIQVEGVVGDRVEAGSTQDFVMVNHPVFVVPDVKAYLALQAARMQTVRGKVSFARLLQQTRHSVGWGWRSAFALARVLSEPPKHPADYAYFSMAPIRFGDFVAKYRTICQTSFSKSVFRRAASLVSHKHAMRHWLAASLRHGELCFLFQVQLRTSIGSMPVEDATVEWPESESPYQTVATLNLPPQDLAAHSELEERSYTVWNCLVDHRPLGGINRVRRAAYKASATVRARH
jgi:catalase